MFQGHRPFKRHSEGFVGPLVIVDRPELLKASTLAATDVKSLLLDAVFN